MACTLGGAKLGERTERWRTLAGRAERREPIPDGLRLVFSGAGAGAGLAASAVVFGLGVLMVRRRRRGAACRTAPARTDLGMPTVGPSPERSEVAKTGR
ncbi:hypothetical protein [Streptomyces malaysiensis]|uniref:hypothetical protein n=1 Tax=Streptomyces malaysiensis TaxID=92644 RepID=UPI0028C4FF7A|nr:hypothetical protein [Streptomyces malaysiensis]